MVVRVSADVAAVQGDVADAIIVRSALRPSPTIVTPEVVFEPRRPPTLVGARGDYWASDVPISMPRPLDDRPVMIDLGGYGFTTGGITVNVTPAEVDEVFFAPFFAPEGELVDA